MSEQSLPRIGACRPVNAKAADLGALIRDAEYFTNEAVKRFDRLAQLRPRGPWAQAATLTRRVQGLASHQLRRQRRAARRAARLGRSR